MQENRDQAQKQPSNTPKMWLPKVGPQTPKMTSVKLTIKFAGGIIVYKRRSKIPPIKNP
jgi:hypothetical protein